MRTSTWASAAPTHRAMRWVTVALCLWVSTNAAGASADAAPGPTVKEVVEFTRIAEPLLGDDDTLQTQIAPNRRYAFLVTRKGNVETDRNRFEILLLDLDPTRLASGRPRAPQMVFGVDATRDQSYFTPSVSDVRWMGSTTLVFRAQIGNGLFQIYRLNIGTRRLTQLTFAQQRIESFAVSQDFKRVLYLARLHNPVMPPRARSLVVENHSFWSVIHGQQDIDAQKARYQYFVAASGLRAAPKPLGNTFLQTSLAPPNVSISPDGRWALLHQADPAQQPAWGQRYPLVAKANELLDPGADPLNYFSRSDSYVARRLVAYRLSDGTARPVLDAPDDAMPGSPQTRMDRLWQGAGESVVIGGTHLPVAPGAATPENTGSHIVEYWPNSGRWSVIARLNGRLDALHAVAGEASDFVAIDAGKSRRFRREPSGQWREVGGGDGRTLATRAAPSPREVWTVRLAQSWDVPPDVVAVGPAGQQVALTRLNPQYSSRWGTVRAHSWTDAKGRRWDGGLMLPHNFDSKAKYPLVIQTYGFVPDKFYLDGPNRMVGYTSGYAGRAFMRENILVLALPWRASSDAPDDERGSILAFMDGVAGAVDSLVSQGWVDRERVGLMGWSATGERVNKLLTFSDVPIRAASVMDGDAGTLFTMAIIYGFNVGSVLLKEQANDGQPFGESMGRWIKNDPSLNTHCVHTALRLETYGPWVLNHWDTYALLRRQYKPVEMIRIPDGRHSLSRPSERMTSLQGNVDWYRFWLKGEERTEVVVPGETDASLKAQYVRWRQMSQLKQADDTKPRCAANRANP